MKIIATTIFSLIVLIGCNNARPGQNTTADGTQQSDNTVNAEMENNRQPADVDTIVSPGSNAIDNRDGNTNRVETSISPTQTGTGTDPNMQGQSDTHGRDTRAGNK